MKYYEVTFTLSGPNDKMADSQDLVAALAGESGFETFEEPKDNQLKGYVQQTLFDEKKLRDSLDEFPFRDVKVVYEVQEAEDKDWNEDWEQQGFEPIKIGQKCLIHDGRHIPEDSSCAETVVEIDTKLAFGTGNHETTRMMVAALTDTRLDGLTVLDAGCGTGILGIVALKRGASHVVGYDIDEWSVDNARHNAIINGVDRQYETLLGDSSVLDKLDSPVDIIVANINRNILLADIARFAAILSPMGLLLLSGFYTSDDILLESKARQLGLTLTFSTNEHDWSCLHFKKE